MDCIAPRHLYTHTHNLRSGRLTFLYLRQWRMETGRLLCARLRLERKSPSEVRATTPKLAHERQPDRRNRESEEGNTCTFIIRASRRCPQGSEPKRRDQNRKQGRLGN